MDHIEPSPIYLLAGGPGAGQDRTEILLKRVIANTGVSRPAIAYVGAASGDNRPFFRMLSDALGRCGAGEVRLVPTARPDRARAVLEASDLVFISGGDVERGMRTLERHQALPTLRSLHAQGRPFFGISAGSIMLAGQWIAWSDPDDDASARLFDCMGLAPVLCDTHGEADGWEELTALLKRRPDGTVGHGIPSGAGLAVHPDGRLEPMGGPVHRYVRRGDEVIHMDDLAI